MIRQSDLALLASIEKCYRRSLARLRKQLGAGCEVEAGPLKLDAAAMSGRPTKPVIQPGSHTGR